jgi:biopolymer transport protein ExbD
MSSTPGVSSGATASSVPLAASGAASTNMPDQTAGAPNVGAGPSFIVTIKKGSLLSARWSDGSELRSCKKISTVSALTACARGAKDQHPNEAAVTILADLDVPYREVIPVFDALRSDGGGELFPEAQLAVAKGAVEPATEPSNSSPGRPLRASMIASGPSADGVTVFVSKTKLWLDENDKSPIGTYRAGAHADAKLPSELHQEPGTLTIPTLQKALSALRAKAPSRTDLILVADEDTSYRYLMSVLVSGELSGFSRFDFLVARR